MTGSGLPPLRVRHGQLHFFVRETLKRVRLVPEFASRTADAMVGANLAGEDQDGVAWLPDLVTDLSTRHVNPAPDMQLVSESGGAGVLDGDNGPGPAVAQRAMLEAIGGANRHGVGSIAVRRSNRLGSAGRAAALALTHQMVGIAIANDPKNRTGSTETKPTDPSNDPVVFGIALPTVETEPPLVLNLRLQDKADISDLPLSLALEFLLTLGGAALPTELAADPHPDPTHRGTAHLFLAFRIRAFAPWADFRNHMVERLNHLRRGRLSYPGQEAGAIEEERRTRGILLSLKTTDALRQMAYQLGMNDIWDGLGK